ncbi:SIS domain-containing protein [Alphaproteobacteria bacterium]|nr:SIS domain-containing protein [Alphaproteobacteria bacterium]MDC1121556.1 SIS domain-containing protein [Alphaproteobacteria bacterium]
MNSTEPNTVSFVEQYFAEVKSIADKIDIEKVNSIAHELAALRKNGGRLFFLGVGGSAANAGHAVNDFRKLCGIESYAPTDNVSELTARTNDEGWETVFAEWLKVSQLNQKDALFVLSVGGGNEEKNISANLISSIQLAKERSASIYGIVGKADGFTNQQADICVHVPLVNEKLVTPHSEAFQAVVWHCLVSHPSLQINQTKW